MSDKTITRIAVSGIKGGTGKTTVSMILGVIAREFYGKKVCFVDCDKPQSALTQQKKSEDLFFLNHPEIKNEIIEKRFPKPKHVDPLPVVSIEELSDKNIARIESVYKEYDFFIYDTKGSEGEPSFFLALTAMDYIILPLILDNINTRASYMWIKGMRYALTLDGCGKRNKGIIALFNKYFEKDDDQLNLKSWWEQTAREEGVEILKTGLKNSSFVEKNIAFVKSANEAYFQSISIVPDDATLSLTLAKEVVQGIIEYIDKAKSPINYSIHRVKNGDPVTDETALQLVEDYQRFLEFLADKLRNKKLVVIQQKMVENELRKLDLSQLKNLIEDQPSMYKDDKGEQRNSLSTTVQKPTLRGDDKVKENNRDDDKDLGEIEQRAVELFEQWLREKHGN